MDIDHPLPLLGGLSPRQFMRHHWHKTPLLVRQALPGIAPPLSRAQVFALAAQDGVESRLVQRDARQWHLQHGPVGRRARPSIRTPNWTLLVQGLDLHVGAARELLERFRFIPDARLDDLMLSYASYDVFLVQVHGRRRWSIGPVDDARLRPGQPLKLLRHFRPQAQWVLEPGDLLYLPPRWGHDGVAVGECMTCSVGFRAPEGAALAAELLSRAAEAWADEAPARGPGTGLYADPGQPATVQPARVPKALQGFARSAVRTALRDAASIDRALGEVLSEPKAQVWFDAGVPGRGVGGVALHARTRMLYDDTCVYLNGVSFEAAGRDANLMRALADTRHLSAAQMRGLSAGARAWVQDWLRAGWLVPMPQRDNRT